MSRRWSRLELTLPVSFVDWVSAEVVEWGSPGVQIHDEPNPGIPAGTCTLEIYFPSTDVENARRRLDAFLTSLGPQASPFTLSPPRPAPDVDWARQWRYHFPPLRLGDRVLVLPPWESGTDSDGRTVILLQPGMAFGTGHHPTTAMVIERLHRVDDLAGRGRVLDIGCGSGILSLAAVRLGATGALGLDQDEEAVRSARENVVLNGLEDRIRIEPARFPTLPEPGPFELVLANVYFTFFQQNITALAAVTATGGLLLASGLQENEGDLAVEQFTAGGYTAGIVDGRDGWVLVEARRR